MSSVKIIFEGHHQNDGNHLEPVLSETDQSYRKLIPFREQEDEHHYRIEYYLVV
jgi:hypothetical protein